MPATLGPKKTRSSLTNSRDLDREAAEAAAAAGLGFIRVPTVGTHPAFLDSLADLLAAHLEGRAPAPAQPAFCSDRCCPSPAQMEG